MTVDESYRAYGGSPPWRRPAWPCSRSCGAQRRPGAAPADRVAGLRRADRLAAALAAERDVGDAALAPLRRDAPVLAARRHARGRLALAARRHPQPRRAGGAARLEGPRTWRASWSRRGAGKLREPGRLPLLESRALRTLTQGHLSQHMFFHSLHQDAIPDAAPEIFGTVTTQFRDLRRSELSPLMICRLNGLSRAHAQDTAEQTLRAMAARGVDGQAIPAAQARPAARPPAAPGPALAAADPLQRPAAARSAARVDRDRVQLLQQRRVRRRTARALVWEGYEAKLAMAKARGEIGVVARRLGGAGAGRR